MCTKLRSITFCLAAILIVGSQITADAAEVTLDQNHWGYPIVDISGTIEKGDLAKIKNQTARMILDSAGYSPHTVLFHLNTGGGDIDEAIKIGRFAREILATIESYGNFLVAPGSESEESFVLGKEPWERRRYVVLHRTAQITEDHIVRNYSAGVLIFYGAVRRASRDNSDMRLGFSKKKKIPVMGLHRPYYDREFFAALSPAQAAKEYDKLEQEVRSYLLEMGAPQSLVDRMFNYASNEIELLTADEFREYYKDEESFLEEWLLAKCGSNEDRDIFEGAELAEFERISKEQNKARAAEASDRLYGGPLYGVPRVKREWDYVYPSANFSEIYIRQQYEKVRDHNGVVRRCRGTAVFAHQRMWAQKHIEP